jgi:hypothetical protein
MAGCVVSLACGAALAWMRPSSSPAMAKAEPSNFDSPGEARGGRPIANALVESIRTGTGAKRWLQLLSTLENARAEDIPGLMHLVRNDPAMVRMLALRWAELDPHHMFGALYTDALLPDDSPDALPSRWVLTDVLFERWARTDLPAFIKAMNDVPNFPGRLGWRHTAFNQTMKVDVERGLQLAREWNVSGYIPDMRSISAWAARDPRHAVQALDGLSSHMASEALKEVGRTWAASDPEGGLRFAVSLEGDRRVVLGSEIVRQWARKNLQGAIAFANAEKDTTFRNTLAQGLVEAWGRVDPAAALAWSQENLSGPARGNVIGGLITSAAEKDLAKAGDLVAGMAPGAIQNQACAALFETWFEKGADQREAAFAWLSSFSDRAATEEAFGRVEWNWLWKDPESVRAFISGPYGYMTSQSLLFRVGSDQGRKNPEAALAWADSLGGDLAAKARHAVVDGWLGVRPEGAADYVGKLPPGSKRDSLVETVSLSLIYQSPIQAVSWYRQLSTAEQTHFRDMAEHSSLDPDARRKLQEAIK